MPAIAGIVPSGGRRESRVKRFRHWLDSDRVGAVAYYPPFDRTL